MVRCESCPGTPASRNQVLKVPSRKVLPRLGGRAAPAAIAANLEIRFGCHVLQQPDHYGALSLHENGKRVLGSGGDRISYREKRSCRPGCMAQNKIYSTVTRGIINNRGVSFFPCSLARSLCFCLVRQRGAAAALITVIIINLAGTAAHPSTKCCPLLT